MYFGGSFHRYQSSQAFCRSTSTEGLLLGTALGQRDPQERPSIPSSRACSSKRFLTGVCPLDRIQVGGLLTSAHLTFPFCCTPCVAAPLVSMSATVRCVTSSAELRTARRRREKGSVDWEGHVGLAGAHSLQLPHISACARIDTLAPRVVCVLGRTQARAQPPPTRHKVRARAEVARPRMDGWGVGVDVGRECLHHDRFLSQQPDLRATLPPQVRRVSPA